MYEEMKERENLSTIPHVSWFIMYICMLFQGLQKPSTCDKISNVNVDQYVNTFI